LRYGLVKAGGRNWTRRKACRHDESVGKGSENFWTNPSAGKGGPCFPICPLVLTDKKKTTGRGGNGISANKAPAV